MRARRRQALASGSAAARDGVSKRRRLRLHRLKCHAPVQFAVGTTRQLRRPTEMKVGMSRVADRPTAVMSLESIYGLGLLGLGHVSHDNCGGEGCGPVRKIRTDVVEIALYRGEACRLQLGRYATYWRARSGPDLLAIAQAAGACRTRP